MAKTTQTKTANAEQETKKTPRSLLVSILTQLEEKEVDLLSLFTESLTEQIAEFYTKIKKTAVRNVSPADRLAMINAAIDEHYSKMPATRSGEEYETWNYETFKLLGRKQRAEKALEKEASNK